MLRIEQELLARGVSHAELCRRTGIHTSTISRLVAGKVHAYPGWRRRIAEALGIGDEDLFQEVDGRPNSSCSHLSVERSPK